MRDNPDAILFGSAARHVIAHGWDDDIGMDTHPVKDLDILFQTDDKNIPTTLTRMYTYLFTQYKDWEYEKCIFYNNINDEGCIQWTQDINIPNFARNVALLDISAYIVRNLAIFTMKNKHTGAIFTIDIVLSVDFHLHLLYNDMDISQLVITNTDQIHQLIYQDNKITLVFVSDITDHPLLTKILTKHCSMTGVYTYSQRPWTYSSKPWLNKKYDRLCKMIAGGWHIDNMACEYKIVDNDHIGLYDTTILTLSEFRLYCLSLLNGSWDFRRCCPPQLHHLFDTNNLRVKYPIQK